MSKKKNKSQWGTDSFQHKKIVSVPEKTFQALLKTFWTVPRGIVYLSEQFALIYPQRLAVLKGMFTQRELMLMIDAMKDIKEFPRHLPAAVFFEQHVKYHIDENRYAIKWDVDGGKLLERLGWLTTEPYTGMALALWAWCGTNGSHGLAKDEYVRELI